MKKLRKLAWALLRSDRSLRLLANRCAPAIEHAAIVRSLDLACVFDVGANIGQFASMVRGIHPSAYLMLFEPLPDAVERLRRIFRGDPRTVVVPQALCAVEGKLPFHVSKRLDSSSLLGITDRQVTEHEGTWELDVVTVPVSRLDDSIKAHEIPPNSMLKLDVQGAELEVLKGAPESLPRMRWVYSEVSFVELYSQQALATEVVQYMLDRQFRIEAIANVSVGLHGLPLQADVLFVNDRPTFR